jgi:hypothetical protein
MNKERSQWGVAEDGDVRAALGWLLSVAQNSKELLERIRVAQAYYCDNSAPVNFRWPEMSALLPKHDLIAGYLAQVDAFLNNRRAYDLLLGSKIVPFFKHIGLGIGELAKIPGATTRAKRLLNPNGEHPDGGIFELVAAVRYAREDFDVEFIPESTERAADMRLGAGGLEKFMHIECKRLRPSVYELREAANAMELFKPLEDLVHRRQLNMHLDVNFKVELFSVPRNYLVDRANSAIDCSILLPGGYPWSDEYADGTIKTAALKAVRADIVDSSLIVGSKMARLLCGHRVSEGTYFIALSADARLDDPRFIDSVDYASVVTWQCSSDSSINARARHIRSKLADIDRQMSSAKMGIVHIGMDAERDSVTADLRRARNLEAVRSFRASSNTVEINLHYFLAHVTESTAWTIDETVDWNSRVGEALLDDPRLFVAASEVDTNIAAWHLPAP